MSSNGDIYVIEFSDGITKVGRAANALERISHHVREASRHGVTIERTYVVAGVKGFKLVETVVLSKLPRAKLVGGNEYFRDVKFDEVISLLKSTMDSIEWETRAN